MKLTITINTDNAAFEQDPALEVARILRVYADKIASLGDVLDSALMDANGNKVGKAEVD